MTHRPRVWLGLLVTLIALLGAGLRFYRIEAQSLWHDEGNSAAMVGRTPDQIAQAAAADIHPPLYYWLLAGWGSLSGNSEIALRIPSAFAGILAIAVIVQIGSRLFNRSTGALAGLLVAVSPFQVYYGQEARMYALLALLSAASVLMTIRVLELPGQMIQGRTNRRRTLGVVIGYVLVSVAGLYTHYTFSLVIIAETLVFLAWLARRRSKLHGLAIWGGLQIATLLAFAPWLPIAIRQLQSWPRLTSGAVGAPTIARTLFYGTTLSASEVGMGTLALALLATLSLLPPSLGEKRRYLYWLERIGLAALWLIVPLSLLLASGTIREPSLKFLLPGHLALSLLIAHGASMAGGLAAPAHDALQNRSLLPRLLAPILLVVGAAPILAGLQNLYFNPAYARDDYRAIAQRIMEEAGPQAAVILDAPNQREVFTYYYPDGPGITPLPDATPVKSVIRVLEANQRVYAVFWANQEQDPQDKVENALQRRAYVNTTTWYGNVRLSTFLAVGSPSDTIANPVDASFGVPVLAELAGYNLTSDTLSPGDALGVTLFWEASAGIETRLKVFVHLIGPDGTLVAQHDGEPRGGLSPTDSWQPHKLVMDNHGLVVPADLPPGVYSLRVGLYQGVGDRLPVMSAGLLIGDSVELRKITITLK